MSRVGLFGQISEINDHLYLSGAGVLKPEKLRQKKITCIVNATTEEPNAYINGIDYLRIRVDDSPHVRLDHYFDMAADKIKATKDAGGKTLVHCMAGVSRSASLCIVYLIKHERMTLRQAYHFVKSARPIIRPNVGFWKQMVDYERRLRGHSTVTMVPAAACDLLIPDVYTDEVKRQLVNHYASAPSASRPSSYSPIVQSASSGLSGFAKRRGLSAGSARPVIGYRRSTSPGVSLTSRSSLALMPANRYNSLTPSLFSPAMSRSRQNKSSDNGSIFSNLYKTSQEMFFPTF